MTLTSGASIFASDFGRVDTRLDPLLQPASPAVNSPVIEALSPDPFAEGPSTAAPVAQDGGATPPPALGPGDIAGGLLFPDNYFSPAQLTFSIPTATSAWPGYGSNAEPFTGYQALSAAQGQRFVDAVALWDSYIAPSITQTNDAAAPGNIRVGFTSYSDVTKSWGYAYQPSYHGGPADPQDGDIWINATNEGASLAAGTYDWEALLHEVGHALSLKHPFEAPALPAQYDNRRYTIMSYTDPTDDLQVVFNYNPDGTVKSASYHVVNPTTPMVLDIAAVQARYGADPNTAAGDTVYTFGQDAPLLQTVYDAGGNDTFDLSQITRGSFVDLTPGAYSSIGYWSVADQIAYWQATLPAYNHDFVQSVYDKHVGEIYTWSSNVATSLTTVIENVIGGSGNDTLIGNFADNVITGGLGADVLTGAGGHDTFRVSYVLHAGDTITDFNAADTLQVTDGDVTTFGYTRIGTGLTLGRGAVVTLANNPVGHLLTTADAGGGVDLTLGAHLTGLNDFNGDGHSDLLWRQVSGGFTTWDLTGNGVGSLAEHANVYVDGSVSNAWQVQGTFDFNGDGASDILWRNTATGAFTVWDASGNGFAQNAYGDGSVSTSWSVTGLGDFNGDGKDDLLWRNANGALTEWQSTGTGFNANTYGTQVDPSWHIVGVGDFNGDGKSDILWRNDGGLFTEWQSTGASFTQNTYIDGSVDKSWHLEAIADFNGDGKADILWRNDNGTFTIWDSTGNGFTPNVYVDSSVGNDWTLVGTADFNDDGRADLLWRNVNGTFTVWESTGSAFSQNTIVDSSVHNDWAVQTHHYDFV